MGNDTYKPNFVMLDDSQLDDEGYIIRPFPQLPGEILDNIFLYLGRAQLMPLLLSRKTHSSARKALWHHLDYSPPERSFQPWGFASSPDEWSQRGEYAVSLRQHFRHCLRSWKWLKRQPDMPVSPLSPVVGEFFKACFEATTTNPSLGPSHTLYTSRYPAVVRLVRELTIVLPGKKANEFDEGTDEPLLGLLKDIGLSDVDELLATLPGLKSLTVLGTYVDPWCFLNMIYEKPNHQHRISLPHTITELIVRDEHTWDSFDWDNIVAWDEKLIDEENTDMLNMFNGYQNIKRLRISADSRAKIEGLAMIRFLPKFLSLETLRLDNIPSTQRDPEFFNPNTTGAEADVGQTKLFERLEKKLPHTCHTLDIRPEHSYLPTGAFHRDWPDQVPHIRTLRMPLRNVFEALQATRSDHAIRFEVLLSMDDLKRHHPRSLPEVSNPSNMELSMLAQENGRECSWICPILKLLEELSIYFETQPNEHRSIKFAIEDVFGGDGVTRVELHSHVAWQKAAFESIEGLQVWLAAQGSFDFFGMPQDLTRADLKEFLEYLELRVPARGYLGVECTSEPPEESPEPSALLHGTWDSDSDSSMGLYGSDEEPHSDGEDDDD